MAGGAKRKRSRMWNSGSGKRSKGRNSHSTQSMINESAAEKIFEEIAEEDDPSAAGMEGICRLCEKLDLNAEEDIRVLVLLWKLGSKEKPAQISKDEWMTGCNKLQVDSIDKFQSMLPSLDTGFLDRAEFKEFYKPNRLGSLFGSLLQFCFKFNLEGTHRTLDKDMVVALMRMVLTGRIPSERLDTFCAFLESQTSYSRITLDQWTSFLDFCYECEDLSTYDESTSAWPVLIDEYVDYMEEQQKK
eukprot:scaffold2299_cov131-Cylindrotheca_fusiformis.AAC.32